MRLDAQILTQKLEFPKAARPLVNGDRPLLMRSS